LPLSVLVINTVRLTLMVQNRHMYETLHGPFGQELFGLLLLLSALTLTLLGVRRELLA
jgi:hypothetical protein